jgi:hypothetical protein
MKHALEFLREYEVVHIYQLVNRLHCEGVELYLTGSRYFGDARQDSDWDFYCEHSEGLTETLIREGFHLETRPDYNDANAARYNDSNTALVFHRGNWGNPEIHIQVVVSAELKSRVQNNRSFRAVYLSLTKKERVALWNMAYAFING